MGRINYSDQKYQKEEYAPFKRLDTDTSTLSLIRVIILLPLVLLRLICFLNIFLVYYVTVRVALLGTRLGHASRAREYIVQSATKYAVRLGLLCMGFWRISCHGSITAPIPSIIVCNHLSWIDILVLIYLFSPSFVAKVT